MVQEVNLGADGLVPFEVRCGLGMEIDLSPTGGRSGSRRPCPLRGTCGQGGCHSGRRGGRAGAGGLAHSHQAGCGGLCGMRRRIRQRDRAEVGGGLSGFVSLLAGPSPTACRAPDPSVPTLSLTLHRIVAGGRCRWSNRDCRPPRYPPACLRSECPNGLISVPFISLMSLCKTEWGSNQISPSSVISYACRSCPQVRFLHDPSKAHGYVGALLSSNIIHFTKVGRIGGGRVDLTCARNPRLCL